MRNTGPRHSAGLITVATWNVNSVKARLSHLLGWLRSEKPDIVLLQELKCTNDAFPAMEIEDLGYNLAIHGEKTYNGVAILSKYPLEDITRGLPGDPMDTQARYIEAVVSVPSLRGASATKQSSQAPWALDSATVLQTRHAGLLRYARNDGMLRVASVYVPNGQSADSDKFEYKLRFLDRLRAHARTLLTYDEPLVIGGDYNIAPTDADVHDPKAWEGSVLTHEAVRRRFRELVWTGMYDAQSLVVSRQSLAKDLRLSTHDYTWWDYRAGAFERDHGLRIDHLLLSPQAADRLEDVRVHKHLRSLEKPSDHAPVFMGLWA